MQDFNLPDISWSHCTSTYDSPGNFSNVIPDCIHDCFLYQLINIQTCIQAGQRANIINLIPTSHEYLIATIHNECSINKSENCMLTFQLNYITVSDRIW